MEKMKKIYVGVSLDVSDIDAQLKKVKPTEKVKIDVSADISNLERSINNVLGTLSTTEVKISTTGARREIQKIAEDVDKLRTITKTFDSSGNLLKIIDKTATKDITQMYKELEAFYIKLDNLTARAKSPELVEFLGNVKKAVDELDPSKVAETTIKLEQLQQLVTQRSAEINKAVQQNKEYAKSQEEIESSIAKTKQAKKEYTEKYAAKIIDIPISVTEVSSTEIREEIRKTSECKMLPESIIEYINEKGLYR